MPLDLEAIVLTADAVLNLAGVSILIAVGVRWFRSGDWRDPLAGVGAPTGPGVVSLTAILLTYVLLPGLGVAVVRRFLEPADDGRPAAIGSIPWHAEQAVAHALLLLVCALVAVVLVRSGLRIPSTGAPAARGASLIAVSAAGVLVLFALTTVQARLSQVLWRAAVGAAPPEHSLLEALLNDPLPPWGRLHVAAMAALVAPLTEELIFRGLLLQVLLRLLRLPWLAVTLAALPFALVHTSVPHSVLPMFTFGVVLGVVRLRHASLSACVLIHALFNLRTLVAVTLAPGVLEA